MANNTWAGVGHGITAGALHTQEAPRIDSNEAQARAWTCALAEYGRGIPLVTTRRMIGMGADQLLPIVADLAPETAPDAAIIARRAALFARDFLPHRRPCPGAWALVARLGGAGWQLVIIGTAPLSQPHHLLAIPGGTNLIDAITASGDALRGRPAPGGVRAALGKAGLRPAEALLLGDNPHDVEATGRAGLAMLVLRCGSRGEADLAGALAV